MFRLLFSNRLFGQLFGYGISQKLVESDIVPTWVPEQDIISGLTRSEKDIALLTPLSYARYRGELLIIPDFIISSPKRGRSSLLFFKDNLPDIKTIYYPGSAGAQSYNRFIAEWILREYYNIDCEWAAVNELTVTGKSMAKYPTIFLEGEASLDTFPDYKNFIDFTEDWVLKTDLPLIHALLCVPSAFSENSALPPLIQSGKVGLQNLEKFSRLYSRNRPQPPEVYSNLLHNFYQYFPDERVWESLEKVLQYIFYSNWTDYYPGITFLEQ